jgi:C1A family cysteine protease
MQNALLEVNKFRRKYTHASQILDDEIPASFSLENVKGVDLSGKVRDQGGCGSCHAHSFIQVAESRLRMQKPQLPDLSVQHLMSCNYLNEGCRGGWSLLHGYFAESVGLVEESCAQYMGEAKNCPEVANCPIVARVNKGYFLTDMSEKGI